MKKKAGEETDQQDLKALENIAESEEPLQNKIGAGKKAKKKADDYAEELDVDPGIDYMRWSE